MMPMAFFQTALFTISRRPSFIIQNNHLAHRFLSLSSNPTTTSTHIDGLVSVFDNVLSPSCCNELTRDELYNVGPDIYRRDQGTLSPQEVLIESILEGLGGTFNSSTKEVEWWGRSIYKSVEAHRDVDEEAASTRGVRRYPTHSLIVYLDVEEGIRGPTCLWIPYTDDKKSASSALLSVPVFKGRLLVFSGELLHGVPCPPLQWLDDLPTLENNHVDNGTMRRVLVLNLWNDKAPKEEEWLDEYDDDEESDWDDEEEDDDEGPIEFFAKKVECEPRSNWKAVPLLQVMEGDDEPTTTSVPATLITRSHGQDELLISSISSHTAISQILESESIPQWIKTSADVTDLGIGVPSVAGSREERKW